MPELKPCPFCNGKAEIVIQRYAGDTDFDATVEAWNKRTGESCG